MVVFLPYIYFLYWSVFVCFSFSLMSHIYILSPLTENRSDWFFYFLTEIMRPMKLRKFIYYLTWGSCCVVREPGVNLMIIKFVAASLRYLFISSGQWNFLPLSLPFLLYFWDVGLRFFLFLKNSLLNSKNCIFHIWFLLWLKKTHLFEIFV